MASALKALYDEYVGVDGNACTRCPRLVKNRTQVVFGEGAPSADLVIVGEAPGATEDEIGRVFVGQSGTLLDEYLAYFARDDARWLMSITRRMTSGYIPTDEEYDQIRDQLIETEKIYYLNAVLCRPPENVDPSKEELAACRDRLLKCIYAVDPLLILAVGKVPVKALLGKDIKITSDRGQVFDIEIPGVTGGIRYPMLVTYHPSFVGRTGDFNSKTGPGQMWAQDLELAFALLDDARALTRDEPRPKRRKWEKK